MDLIKTLEQMMLVGSAWILYLLIFLSVCSLGIALERFFFFRRLRVDFQLFCKNLSADLHAGRTREALASCENLKLPEARLVREAMEHANFGAAALEHHLRLVINDERQQMDRGILFLGTVGSNAPFIGLLGTVFGVIEAFHQLAMTGAGGSNAVMTGISEALVATAVGLIVAIPAVVLFNVFSRAIKKRVANLEALRDLILSYRYSERVEAQRTSVTLNS